MLRYTGGGYGGSLPGVPARDLSDAEAKEICRAHGITVEFLIGSGLYARGEAKAMPRPSAAVEPNHDLKEK